MIRHGLNLLCSHVCVSVDTYRSSSSVSCFGYVVNNGKKDRGYTFFLIVRFQITTLQAITSLLYQETSSLSTTSLKSNYILPPFGNLFLTAF